jgi:hypothetical protein
MLQASRKVGLEVSTKKTKYIVIYHYQNIGQSHILVPYKSFKNVVKFKYFKMTITDHNHFHEEIKSRLNSGNACYHSIKNLFPSHCFSRHLKIKIYITIMLPAVLDGCETWSLIRKEERRLRMFENRVLRRIFWT